MKWNNIYILIFSILFISCNQEKKGYVQASKLYNEFEMAKELNKKLEQSVEIKSQILDSLKFELKQIELQIGTNQTKDLIRRYKLKQEEFLYKEKQFNEDAIRQQQLYTEQTTTQINKYILEFGKQNQYDYIFGANGNGSILYAKDDNDITSEILIFINNKYQGN